MLAARSTALLALGLLVVAMLSVLRISGALADAADLAAVVVALILFCRAVFRVAERDPPPPSARGPKNG